LDVFLVEVFAPCKPRQIGGPDCVLAFDDRVLLGLPSILGYLVDLVFRELRRLIAG
jgi:hypothetical protein